MWLWVWVKDYGYGYGYKPMGMGTGTSPWVWVRVRVRDHGYGYGSGSDMSASHGYGYGYGYGYAISYPGTGTGMGTGTGTTSLIPGYIAYNWHFLSFKIQTKLFCFYFILVEFPSLLQLLSIIKKDHRPRGRPTPDLTNIPGFSFGPTVDTFIHLTLVLPRGGSYYPLENFSLSSQNQKESDLSHLGNLKYILCDHFHEKNWGTGGRGVGCLGKASRRRCRVRGWLPPEKIKSCHFEKYIDFMVLTLCILEMSFPSVISQKLGEILIFRTLLWNFQFWPRKSAILSLAMIMTSLWCHTWDVGTYFGMYRKRRPLAILWYQLHVCGVSFSSSQGGSNNPLGKTCYKKGLVRWGLRLFHPVNAKGCAGHWFCIYR